jgi:hypothetical protein
MKRPNVSADIQRTYGQTKLIGRNPPESPPTGMPHEPAMDAKPAALSEGRGNESSASDSHDLHNRYFSSNPILLSNIDPFRARDLFFCVTLLYAVFFSLLGFNDRFSRPAIHLWHAVIWRLLHSVGLGIVLHRQSRDRWFVRHYFKHYFFKRDPAVAVVQEAFSNWTAIYNFSLTMTYVSFGLLALALAEPLNLARLSSDSLRLTGGVALIALHAWTARATYEVIGSFGWFVSLTISEATRAQRSVQYGDFFVRTLL